MSFSPLRILLGIFVVFLAVFISDFVIHQLFMQKDYEATSKLWRHPDEMLRFMHFMLAGQLLGALAFTFLYLKGFSGSPLKGALVFGLLIACFHIAIILIFYAVMPLTIAILIKWVGTTPIIHSSCPRMPNSPSLRSFLSFLSFLISFVTGK
ncbi:MAG: hypothetical protein AAF226_12660, partial [Verrucomicrobiota bacterium]